MTALVVILALFVVLPVAAVRWGADSRRLDRPSGWTASPDPLADAAAASVGGAVVGAAPVARGTRRSSRRHAPVPL